MWTPSTIAWQVDGVHNADEDDRVKKYEAQRRSYRHGNLRAALLEAALQCARADGPEAVVLREATRRAGVVPNAAYRHFADRDRLLAAVRAETQALLADSMRQALDEIPADLSPSAARARLRAIGAAYLRFARREPGWFLTAFSGPDPDTADDIRDDRGDEPADPDPSVPAGPPHPALTPYGLLAQVLDDLVTAGALAPERRPNAELTAWSSVHGLAMLVIAGPLRHLGDTQVEQAVDHLLMVVDRGLTAPSAGPRPG
jgi:AcrR family transcriptional regulator